MVLVEEPLVVFTSSVAQPDTSCLHREQVYSYYLFVWNSGLEHKLDDIINLYNIADCIRLYKQLASRARR